MTRPKHNQGMYLPQICKDTAVLHTLDNNSGEPDTPLIQLVHGDAGQGKSTGLRAILAALKAKVFIFGGSQFESVDAGRPAGNFEEVFESAMETLHSSKPSFSAVLIDDLDMGIGNFGGNIQYTVNRQHFVVTLMHLCDRYSGKRHLQRPAVFVTANRPDVLDGPLIRDGRCEKFLWTYLPAEREEIIHRLYPQLPRFHVQALNERFPEEPIAFFAGLKRLVRRKAAVKLLREKTTEKAVSIALLGKWRVPTSTTSLEELIAFGDESIANRPVSVPSEEIA
jgi:SpoVK/Ycf46/Vps4 family AAA+-type ATPase